MPSNLGDLHRSRLETLLAIEVEYQKKILALSNQRIQAIRKMLTDVGALHMDVEGDVVLVAASSNESTPTLPTASTKKSEKRKKKKATPPTKPAKLVAGKAPRLIDALQMIIRNKQVRPKEAYEALKAKNWLPRTSKDPLGYIRFTLSDEKEIFHRVDGQRGVYELDPSNPYYNGKFSKRTPTDEVEDPPESSPEELTSKVVAAPSPPVSGESPPAIGTDEAYAVVDDILADRVQVDG